MSAINAVTTSHPSTSTVARRSTISQTAERPQSESNASSATISQAARDALAATVAKAAQASPSVTNQSSEDTSSSAISVNTSPSFKHAMAEKLAGGNAIRTMIQNDPSNPMWAKNVDFYAEHDFTGGLDIGYDISHTLGGASGNPTIDGVLRYSSGETVTAESQTYATKQTSDFQNKLREMIGSEKAKGTTSSDILLQIFDLQETQPSHFRAMMGWPTAADFAINQPGGVKS